MWENINMASAVLFSHFASCNNMLSMCQILFKTKLYIGRNSSLYKINKTIKEKDLLVYTAYVLDNDYNKMRMAIYNEKFGQYSL